MDPKLLINYNKIAIFGIHTGIGKTIVSAVLAEALGADYWKPVQAGLDERDTETVRKLVSSNVKVFDEAIVLSQPLSPHAAAIIDNVKIDHTLFNFPMTEKLLLIETAGGVLSPLNDKLTMADFIRFYSISAILVVKNYLGSINHTLLSIEVMQKRGIKLLGIIVNGDINSQSETFIEQYSGVPIIARVPHFACLNRESIKQNADEIMEALKDKLHISN